MYRRLILLLTTVSILSGCGSVKDSLTSRFGPYPVPSAAVVEEAAAREAAIVQIIAQAAGYPYPNSRLEWYNVVLVGFNVVDDACMTYIDDLWILERRKARNSTLITATGAAVSAIVRASGNPSASTLDILTQAFGLASAINNAFAESYLYTQNAATIKKLVRITTDAYRADLAKNFYGKTEIQYPLGSSPAAYHHMREYLALCLPPTIQAQIEDLVAKAKAGPEESAAEKNVAAAKSGVFAPTSKMLAPMRTTPSIKVF